MPGWTWRAQPPSVSSPPPWLCACSAWRRPSCHPPYRAWLWAGGRAGSAHLARGPSPWSCSPLPSLSRRSLSPSWQARLHLVTFQESPPPHTVAATSLAPSAAPLGCPGQWLGARPCTCLQRAPGQVGAMPRLAMLCSVKTERQPGPQRSQWLVAGTGASRDTQRGALVVGGSCEVGYS